MFINEMNGVADTAIHKQGKGKKEIERWIEIREGQGSIWITK